MSLFLDKETTSKEGEIAAQQTAHVVFPFINTQCRFNSDEQSIRLSEKCP